MNSPDYLKAFGEGPLQAQVLLLLHSFRYAWSIALLPFGIHLILLGWLIIRSGYIPWILGSLLIIDGLGWMIDTLQPYLLPGVDVGFTSYTALGELIFMLWLLIRAWKIESDATIRSRLDTRLHQL